MSNNPAQAVQLTQEQHDEAVKNLATKILGLLNNGGDTIQPNVAMEALSGVILSVATVGGITGSSSNSKYSLTIVEGDIVDGEINQGVEFKEVDEQSSVCDQNCSDCPTKH